MKLMKPLNALRLFISYPFFIGIHEHYVVPNQVGMTHGFNLTRKLGMTHGYSPMRHSRADGNLNATYELCQRFKILKKFEMTLTCDDGKQKIHHTFLT